MPTETQGSKRNTDRVSLVIRIQVFGSDVAGQAFSEDAHTVEVSRHGALIAMKHDLTPQDEIVIRRERTGKEAVAQVMGRVREDPDGQVYGVRFLDPEIDLWEINFVPLSEAERAVGRSLLECAKCQLREVVYLEEFEIEVYKANNHVFRPCKHCRETTIWKESLHEPKARREPLDRPPEPPPPPPEAARTRNERRHNRITCKLRACIRYAQYEDEVLEASDVSRGGFGFVSRKQLSPGWRIDVAIPYSPNAGNIFVPAKIVRARPVPNQPLVEYGAAYIKP